VTQAAAQVGAAVGHKRPDLILLNDDDLSYAKVRLDRASYKFGLENLSKFEDPLARARSGSQFGMLPVTASLRQSTSSIWF